MGGEGLVPRLVGSVRRGAETVVSTALGAALFVPSTLTALTLSLIALPLTALTALTARPLAALAEAPPRAARAAKGAVTRTMESEKGVAVASATKQMVQTVMAGLLASALVFSLSVFIYAAFYHAYMPVEMHKEEVELLFQPCDTKPALCSFPNASMSLKSHLMSGQAYSVSLLLEVPDSPVNQDLGMFLSCLTVLGPGGPAGHACRSSILEYRSELLRVIETLALAPLHLTGLTTQRQWVRVTYFPDYLDDPSAPASDLRLEIRSKFIQIYSAKMEIHAQLSGLRHVMYHHPWISSIAGILANILTLSVVVAMSWSTLTGRALEPALADRRASESSSEGSEATVLLEKPGRKEVVETVGGWK